VKSRRSTAKVLFLGLEESLAKDLSSALPGYHASMSPASFENPDKCHATLQRNSADLVFCSARHHDLQVLLEAAQRFQPATPVVVVTRHPEVNDWLDVLEAGAADYCAAPFESQHLGWILQSNLGNAGTYRSAGSAA
jgi:DNA-binding NtrC family response regulator